jgi:hypothetical protein
MRTPYAVLPVPSLTAVRRLVGKGCATVGLLTLLVVLVAAALPAASSAAVPRDAAPRQAAGPDRDADGTPDERDSCPDEAGGQQGINGCPDPDGDFVVGSADACPAERGSYQDGGCPDSDGDRVLDNVDACPSQGHGYDGAVSKDGCPDGDRDGVADSKDKCNSSTAPGQDHVDEDGCGPYGIGVSLFSFASTGQVADGSDVHVQCWNTQGVPCTAQVTITLSKASARKLKVGARILRMTLKTSKRTGVYLYTKQDADLSKRVLRAFDRATAARIAVTLTLAGSYRIGSDASRSLGSKTFTLTRKDPSGAYRFVPGIGAGPDGPTKEKKPSDDDF